jgi:hypothetical protein
MVGQFGVVLSNLAYLAELPGLDFGEKNGKAAFRSSSARPRDGSSKTAKALPGMKSSARIPRHFVTEWLTAILSRCANDRSSLLLDSFGLGD